VTGDRGTALLFFPAGLLVVVALAAIAVDLARLHLVDRAVEDAAAAAANDAVTVGLDEAAFRTGAGYQLDPRRAAQAASATVAGHRIEGVRDITVATRLVDDRAVEVQVEGSVPLGFARVLPLAPAAATVAGRAQATAELR
jgi:hypothetical protein